MNAIKRKLLELGKVKSANPEKYKVHFSSNEEINKFLDNIQEYSHAYVLACLMDRQIKAEKAWEIPYKIKQLLGTFEITELSSYNETYYIDIFQEHKLHRLTNEMGKIFFQGIKRIKETYGGNASNIWSSKPSSASVVYHFLQFNGCGIKIATMAANILKRQYGIEYSDYCSIDVSPDVHVRRTMSRLGLIPSKTLQPDLNKINELIIYMAREINPEYPGIIDYALWDIGKNICRPKNPQCHLCELSNVCKRIIHENY
ncbi:hypothetical protein [uncultured Desulfovibrio sp.]|uniref:hypothetical protein n=1 Tax=uncultured Desulfovibrio sp. TaxID=167968 RepID=UPI00280446BC|nr:hypothetical protein [uncultured Desulfovibrio sp.]